MIDLEIFTEQAEYISGSSFEKWTISHHNEANLVKKLTQGGAKLIVGPRGCGKTTLMLKAYGKLKTSVPGVLPIYVNFKSSLKLEPLYRSNSNAAFWFNQWLLLKVVRGLYESLREESPELVKKIAQVDNQINMLEMARIDVLNSDEEKLTVSSVEQVISEMLLRFEKQRCVLFLDDAGHAFSGEQQHDFFEFFREIKTKQISPKAAVYPGVTSYSSAFHVGHDAEKVDVWLKPTDAGYLEFMYSLLKSRLGSEVFNKLQSDKNLLNLMCFSAYGIPRSLLNMISVFCDEDDNENIKTSNIKLDSKKVLKAIKENFDNTYRIYDSLKVKLPLYRNFVDTGSNAFEAILKILKEFNKGSDVGRQSTSIAIQRPISSEFSKVIGFFQYSGLLSPLGISNRGNKGVYEIYELHFGAIVDRNVFFSSRGVSVENYCKAFSSRPNHFYPRHTEASLTGAKNPSEIFILALPPCDGCKAPRLSSEARFCSNCGIKLKDSSVFDNIVGQGIESLPITKHRATSIKLNSNIRTIKDILMDYENKELRGVPMVGPFWAKTIRSYAEEYIA